MYKRQPRNGVLPDPGWRSHLSDGLRRDSRVTRRTRRRHHDRHTACLLYTSDAADERSSVDLGGRRIIKKKKKEEECRDTATSENTHEQ